MTFLFLATLLYFLPAILGRNKADFTGILLLNLLLGWTVIGWFAALIWACSSDRVVPMHYVPVSSGRFCSNCGTASPVGARYCGACGRHFS
jgi:hypothetical protein